MGRISRYAYTVAVTWESGQWRAKEEGELLLRVPT